MFGSVFNYDLVVFLLEFRVKKYFSNQSIWKNVFLSPIGLKAHEKWYMTNKESYSRVYEGEQQSKQFIIYDLDSIARVNDNQKYQIIKNVRECSAEALSCAVWASRMWSGALANWATETTDKKAWKTL